MNNKEIEQFMNAFEDFMKHAEVQELCYEGRKAAQDYVESFYEKKAAELEVTVDYYMSEFI